MKIITDFSLDTSGDDPVLTLTTATREMVNGVLVQPTESETETITLLATFKLGSGDPPVDGTVLNQCYYDTVSGKKYLNSSWPTTATPVWVEI